MFKIRLPFAITCSLWCLGSTERVCGREYDKRSSSKRKFKGKQRSADFIRKSHQHHGTRSQVWIQTRVAHHPQCPCSVIHSISFLHIHSYQWKLQQVIGKHSNELLSSLLQSLGELHEIEAGQNTELHDAVQNALGSAITAMGPEAFLSILPLNIEEWEFVLIIFFVRLLIWFQLNILC